MFRNALLVEISNNVVYRKNCRISDNTLSKKNPEHQLQIMLVKGGEGCLLCLDAENSFIPQYRENCGVNKIKNEIQLL